MKNILPFLIGALLCGSSFGQNPLPESDPISTYPTGLYYQRGPGASNTVGWTYPYGTKITVHHDNARNFELSTMNKDGQLVFRQFYDATGAWTGWKTLLNSDENGNYGIGTANPTTKLHVIGGMRSTEFIAVEKDGAYRVALNGVNDGYITGRNDGAVNKFLINSNGASYFDGGNVLIGKTSQTNTAYKLDVAGSVRANEIVVNTTGADYVFEGDYPLKTLSEVEAFIEENGHLPDIPSAQEMQTSGMEVGELNTRLLKKIEELTLYLIDQNKKLESYRQENTRLHSRIESFENKLTVDHE